MSELPQDPAPARERSARPRWLIRRYTIEGPSKHDEVPPSLDEGPPDLDPDEPAQLTFAY